MPSLAAGMLCTLVIPARNEHVAPAVQYVSAVAATQGLTADDCLHLEGAVEEACANVVKHAFAANERGTIRLEMTRQPGAIAVKVCDEGLPADLSDVAEGRGLGLGSRVMQAFADEVRFLNLGPEGKCLELVKRLPYAGADTLVGQAPPPADIAPHDLPEVTLRFMRPDEALALARCIYFAYGYSYFSAYVYFPEKTREMLESGLLVSCVAVTPQSDIVGHCGIVFDRLDDRTPESAVAVVLPAYRGLRLFERMKQFLMNAARDGLPTPPGPPRTLLGLFSEGATVHPFTQKVNNSLGAHEVGAMLAFAPASMQYKAIEGGVRAARQNAFMFYARIHPEPHRDVHAPPRHWPMLARIYAQSNLDRALAPPAATCAGTSQLESRTRQEWGHGYITVNRCGPDLPTLLKQQLQALHLQKVECVLLDLPLADPGTPAACDAAEALGFFFGGVHPEKRSDGDVLRLQYLHDVQPDLVNMHAVSPFSRELLDYVMSCMPA